MIAIFLAYKAYRRHPRITVLVAGFLAIVAAVAGGGRLYLRFYAPARVWTPMITDPGPNADAAAFAVGLAVFVLTAAALLALTDQEGQAA